MQHYADYTHTHRKKYKTWNFAQVQNINMTLFHNPEITTHNKSTEFSLLSSLNWIYFQQHTVNQFPNKKIHPLSKHQQYSKNNKLHIHIYTFSNNKSCFSIFWMLVLVFITLLIKRVKTEDTPTLIKVTIVKCSFFDDVL